MFRLLAELPVRAIAWLSDTLEIALRLIGRLFQLGEQEQADQAIGISGRIRRAIGSGFWFLANLITYPFAGFFFRGQRFWRFIGSVPFFAACLGLLALWLVILLNHERILNRYLSRVQSAYTKQEGELGARYARRWIDEPGYANPDRKFLYSLVQIQSGQTSLGERVLEQLSPEDSSGLGIAHFWRAGKYAAELDRESIDEKTRRESLERFRWHLSHASGVRPAQITVLEAMDAYWDGRHAEAREKYQQVWQNDPLESVGYASLLKRLGNETEREEVLKQGAQRVAGLLRADPWNRGVRYQLSGMFEASKDWGRAEQIFIEGYQIHRDADSLNAYRSFLSRRAVAGLQEPKAFREQAYCLVRLLRTQGATPGTLEVVSKTCLRTQEELLGLQSELNQWLVEGLDLPLVHLCLSICKAIEGQIDSSVWHVDQARRYDSNTQKLLLPICDYLIVQSRENLVWQERLEQWKMRFDDDPEMPNPKTP